MFNDITPRLGLENQYFFYNTRNDLSVQVPSDLMPTGILSVKTEITTFKVLDLFFGTRGWYGQHSFQQGGMYWGTRFRPLPNLSIYFRHDSIHAFDNSYNTGKIPTTAKGWSQDQIGFELHYNFDGSGKDNLFNRIFGK